MYFLRESKFTTYFLVEALRAKGQFGGTVLGFFTCLTTFPRLHILYWVAC